MKIGIIGAAGNAGQALFREAIRRGDRPTAIVRDRQTAEGVLGDYAAYLQRDARKLTASDLANFDVVIDALNTPPADAAQHVVVARHLVEQVRGRQGPRLVFILGSASLTKDGALYLDELFNEPGSASWISIPEQQLRELNYLRTVEDVDWTAVSPSADFVPGPPKRPVLGGDELLFGPGGHSRVTTGTLAVAVLDEIHDPQHVRRRFTVRDEDC